MKLCLASTSVRTPPVIRAEFQKQYAEALKKIPYFLESFFYWKDWQKEMLQSCKMYIADSGAFSYMSGVHGGEIKRFTADYIKFLRKYDIKLYMEMDVDALVGLEKVEYLRAKMEDYTGRPCIPVFHKSRGLDYWHKMCEEYDYVAIGTMHEYKGHKDVIKSLVSIARQKGTKVHGLGYTEMDAQSMGFYSVDSSTWLSAGRFGEMHIFKDGRLTRERRDGQRVKDYLEADLHNMKEWIKYQHYLARGDKE